MRHKDEGFFARHPMAALMLIGALYLFASDMDYQDQKRMEAQAAAAKTTQTAAR